MMMDKPIVYAPIPEFDQTTQAVFQLPPVDMGSHIFMGIEVCDLPPDMELNELEEMINA